MMRERMSEGCAMHSRDLHLIGIEASEVQGIVGKRGLQPSRPIFGDGKSPECDAGGSV